MKAISLYVLLVGVPILAVAGILRVGQRLRSPIFVGGTWNIEWSPKTVAASKCGESFILSSRVLTIYQSGSHLLLTIDDQNRTTLAGEIFDTTITATTANRVSNESLDAQGRSHASMRLRATVERETGSDRLVGALTLYDCPISEEPSFSAQREITGTKQRR